MGHLRPRVVANIDIVICGFNVDTHGEPDEEMHKVEERAKELIDEIVEIIKKHGLEVMHGNLGVGLAIPKDMLSDIGEDDQGTPSVGFNMN